MKLLILTQKVDQADPILGFFHEWIREFSKNCQSVIVICLEKGSFDLPPNVKVVSLGKERGVSKLGYVLNFYKLIWKLRKDYDAVFVHMNQVYVLLGGLFWKAYHKKIALWYVHRQATPSLYLAEKLVDQVFTSSKESFPIKSNRVNYVGHGIDSSRFVGNAFNQDTSKTNIVYVGRVTSIKNIETLILAGEILYKKLPKLSIEIYGDTMNDRDLFYMEKLKDLIRDKSLENVVLFKGSIPNIRIAEVYRHANLSVNMSPIGGWDKAVIESIVALCPVFVMNNALKPVFLECSDRFLFKYQDPNDLAQKIESFLSSKDQEEVMQNLKNHAIKQYDFKNLLKYISQILAR